MRDIKTVFWKEWRELLFQPGGRSKYTVFVFIALIGILIPMQKGELWLHSTRDLVFPFFLPIFVIMGVIADAIAGEKERHTLETLLASRLSTTSILLGKIAVSVSYYFLVVVIGLSLGCIIFYAHYSHIPVFPFSPEVMVCVFLFSLLIALLITTIGVLISLWASTVKQAQQVLSLGLVALCFIPVLGLKIMPVDWQLSIMKTIAGFTVKQLFLLGGVILVVLDTFLILFTISRFKRVKIVLN